MTQATNQDRDPSAGLWVYGPADATMSHRESKSRYFDPLPISNQPDVSEKVMNDKGVDPVKGFQPEWTRRCCGQSAAWVGLACLALALSSPWAFANPLFAGVTSIEATDSPLSGEQGLNFHADLPFQYQMQVQDADHIILRLYNARLADRLITAEGDVNILSGGAIQSAMLRQPSPKGKPSVDYQEIILSGPGLGQKKLKIMGAQALPLPVAKSVASLSDKRLDTGSQPAKSGQQPIQSSTPLAQANIKTQTKTQKLTEKKQDQAFHQVTQQPVAMMALPDAEKTSQQSNGPQIASVTDVAGHRITSGMPLVVENRQEPTMPASQTFKTAESEAAQSPAPLAELEEAPEPEYQVLTPLPRYQGGAAPIQAMTTDQQGNPVLVRPKNQVIPEFAIASINEGYNTLFQAEPESDSQKVSRLMAQALGAYQNQQFKQALAPIQQALGLDTDNADLHAALAEIQMKLNQPKLASEAYAKAFKHGPDKYGQRYAQVLVLSGQRQQAVAVLKQLYSQNTQQAEIAYMLGTLYEEMGQTVEALPYLKQAAELHPASADIQYNLGLAYELSGDRLLAERHYQKALSLNHDAVDARNALSRVKAADSAKL
jgi:tetratricopeptide (TPR) repeat protein